MFKQLGIFQQHSAESSVDSALMESFTMVVYEKIFWNIQKWPQYIWHRNNIVQLYFVFWDRRAALEFV